MDDLSFDGIVNSWDAAADDRGAIHPSGKGDGYLASGIHQAEIADAIVSRYSEHRDRVLDFACGDGRVAMHLVRYFPEVWGGDSSEGMLKGLEALVPTAHPIQTNGKDGKLAGMDFDAVFAWAVFIHHSHADGAELLKALAEATRPGGILALDIPVYAEARERIGWCDVTVWTEKMLREAAWAAGLKVLELVACPGAFPPPHPDHGALKVFRRE